MRTAKTNNIRIINCYEAIIQSMRNYLLLQTAVGIMFFINKTLFGKVCIHFGKSYAI